GCNCRSKAAGCDDHRRIAGNELGCQRRQLVVPALRPAVFDLDVLSFDESVLGETAMKSREIVLPADRRCAAEKSDQRESALGERWSDDDRRRCRCAADQRDEFAALHSITSSASASSLSGTGRPSALAVLRLMTSSNLVGCTTGSSPGFSPLRIRAA